MKNKTFPKSIRKFIRKEKSRIRRQVLDIKEQEEQIKQLYEKFLKNKSKNKNKELKKINTKKYEDKRNS